MLRSENPFNNKLTSSKTFALLRGGIANFDTEHILINSFMSAGGKIEKRNNHSIVSVNHSVLDGLGALFFLDQILNDNPYEDESNLNVLSGFIDGYEFRQTFALSLPRIHDETFTQRFTKALLSSQRHLREEKIAFVVNVADPSQIRIENLWGNGIAVDVMKGRELEAYCSLPKTKWRKLLKFRATRTLDFVKAGKITSERIDSLLISSIGDLSNFLWASRLNPTNFLISATPASNAVANLILWSRGGIQCLSICASPDHWVLSQWSEIVATWSEVS